MTPPRALLALFALGVARRDELQPLGVRACLVINLARRADRWRSLERHVADVGIDPSDLLRLEAVDGRSLVLADAPGVGRLFDLRGWRYGGATNPHQDHAYRRAVLGCALSHIAAWRAIAMADGAPAAGASARAARRRGARRRRPTGAATTTTATTATKTAVPHPEDDVIRARLRAARWAVLRGSRRTRAGCAGSACSTTATCTATSASTRRAAASGREAAERPRRMRAAARRSRRAVRVRARGPRPRGARARAVRGRAAGRLVGARAGALARPHVLQGGPAARVDAEGRGPARTTRRSTRKCLDAAGDDGDAAGARGPRRPPPPLLEFALLARARLDARRARLRSARRHAVAAANLFQERHKDSRVCLSCAAPRRARATTRRRGRRARRARVARVSSSARPPRSAASRTVGTRCCGALDMLASAADAAPVRRRRAADAADAADAAAEPEARGASAEADANADADAFAAELPEAGVVDGERPPASRAASCTRARAGSAPGSPSRGGA